MFLHQCLFELSFKNTHRNTPTHIRTHTSTLYKYSIVAFCKNATIISPVIVQTPFLTLYICICICIIYYLHGNLSLEHCGEIIIPQAKAR